jgi:ATP-dependent Lon protease
MTGEITCTRQRTAGRRAQGEGPRRLPRRHPEIILPEENEKDLEEISDDVRAEMTFHLADHMDKVLENALVHDVAAGVPTPPVAPDSSFESPPIAP